MQNAQNAQSVVIVDDWIRNQNLLPELQHVEICRKWEIYATDGSLRKNQEGNSSRVFRILKLC